MNLFPYALFTDQQTSMLRTSSKRQNYEYNQVPGITPPHLHTPLLTQLSSQLPGS